MAGRVGTLAVAALVALLVACDARFLEEAGMLHYFFFPAPSWLTDYFLQQLRSCRKNLDTSRVLR